MPINAHHNRTKMLVMAVMAALTFPPVADAQATSSQRSPDLLGSVTQCRGIVNDTERLACFDAAAASLAAAGEIAVLRREDVRQNQRRLFGFNVSTINPFDESGVADMVQSISATLVSARDLGRNEWILTLDDGSVWRKIDSATPIFSSRRQYPVTVRRAALGSYMMKVGDTPAFRVRRE